MSKSLISAGPQGFALRLILEERADRFSHRVEVLGPAMANSYPPVLAALASVEGTSDENWPLSPPLQSCSIEEVRPGQTAAFLVGMAGNSHWSASIEPVDSRGEIVFDFACRVQRTPSWLGTTYDLDALSQHLALSQSDDSAQVILGLEGCQVLLQKDQTAESPSGRIALDGSRRLRIACTIAAPIARATTLRWRYRLSLTASPT